MIKTKYVKSRQVSKTTFELPEDQLPQDLENVFLVGIAGEFNQWNPASSPMKYSKKKKAYRTEIDLDPGQEYQFRYVVNGEHWLNDSEAHKYAPNEFGEENSVCIAAEAIKED